MRYIFYILVIISSYFSPLITTLMLMRLVVCLFISRTNVGSVCSAVKKHTKTKYLSVTETISSFVPRPFVKKLVLLTVVQVSLLLMILDFPSKSLRPKRTILLTSNSRQVKK